jgi:hypothetical protein
MLRKFKVFLPKNPLKLITLGLPKARFGWSIIAFSGHICTSSKLFEHSRIQEATSVPGELLNWRNNVELGPSNWNVCVCVRARVENGLVDGN